MDQASDKIVQFHLEEYVHECLKKNYTPAEIAINIKTNYGIEVSSFDVGNYIQSFNRMEKSISESNIEKMVVREVPKDLARIDALITYFWNKLGLDTSTEEEILTKDVLAFTKVLMDLWNLKFRHLGVARTAETPTVYTKDEQRAYDILRKHGVSLDSKYSDDKKGADK